MSFAEGEKRRLHPATLLARSVRIVPQMLAGGAGYAAVIQREGLGRVVLFAFVAAGLGLVGAALTWWRFRYSISSGEIVIERGLLHRQRRVIPFDRVQDIAIERPPLARLFGTARVKIETGGSSADEGHLDMVALDDALDLRDRLRRWHGGEVATPDKAPEPFEPLLFSMSLPRVLLSGLFNFSLVFLAVILGLLQYLDDFGFFEVEEWVTPEQAEAAASGFSARSTIALLLLLLILGVVAGIARTLARDFGFRLTRAASGFRRKRGLFTLTELVIPLRRVQVGLIESGPVARRLGWHALSFQTLGAEQKEGGVQVAAPFARLEEIRPILDEADFPPPPPRALHRRPPRRALLGWVLPWLLLAAAATGAALSIDVRAAAGSAILLFMAFAAAIRWRRHGWVLGDRALTVSTGFLKRRSWVIPFEKAQSISVLQGPLQRLLGLATLVVDTAGASLFRGPDIVDMDAREARQLADRLLAAFYRERARYRLG